MLTAKKFLVLGAFALTGIVFLYVFTLLSGGGQPAGSTAPGTEGVSVATEQHSEPLPAKTETQSPFLPQAIFKATCAKYSDLPPDVVPCEQAYEFMLKNHDAGTSGLWLMYEAQDGSLKQLVGSESEINAVIAAGVKRLMWYAVSETEPYTVTGSNTTSATKYVLLDARNLSVIKETP
ncbi:hypothetical protein HYY73_03010 [Candidatus Woesearchaeota archaeon]|nr:hypothetical protein [Candidatus Woesearchaeota archaeon]